MSDHNFEISIIRLVNNELSALKESMGILREQRTKRNYEIIIIDSGSNDGSIEFIKEIAEEDSRVRLHQIEPDSFHHARTRNLGVDLAKGGIVCFLNGDAIPVDNNWLENLVSPIGSTINLGQDLSGIVAASYSRQIPRNNADLPNRIRMTYVYDEQARDKLMGLPLSNNNLYFFSSVSCCIDLRCLEKPLFDNLVPVGEDLALGYRLISAGYAISYAPSSRVVHSHNYTMLGIFRRYFDSIRVCQNIGIHSQGRTDISDDISVYLRHIISCLSDKRPLDWLHVFAFFGLGWAGMKLGRFDKYLPATLKNWITVYGV